MAIYGLETRETTNFKKCHLTHYSSVTGLKPALNFNVRGSMEEAEHLIKEAKAFLNAAWNTADDNCKNHHLYSVWTRPHAP